MSVHDKFNEATTESVATPQAKLTSHTSSPRKIRSDLVRQSRPNPAIPTRFDKLKHMTEEELEQEFGRDAYVLTQAILYGDTPECVATQVYEDTPGFCVERHLGIEVDCKVDCDLKDGKTCLARWLREPCEVEFDE